MFKLKKVLLVGAKGSMGVRYAAILRALGVDFIPVDRDDTWPVGSYDSAIVATPTETHVDLAASLCREGIPVLVEKPLSKNVMTAGRFCDDASDGGWKVRMVNQYLHMPRSEPIEAAAGATFYDYFRSGKDGLLYDCISLVALASGPISLNDKSPIWRCMINGCVLSLEDMDKAYCDMIARFLTEPPEGPEVAYIRMAQEKAHKISQEAKF